MGIVAKYKFNQTVYADFIPEFNSEFTDYTITDEIDTDGVTIRTIESDNLPTLIRFGQVPVSGESGASCFGLVVEALQDKELVWLKEQLGLNSESKILCISTEGDTDKANYRSIVWDGAYHK